MSTITFIVAYTILAITYLYLHRPATGQAAPPRARRVRRVTDLRTGLEHPTRDGRGRFLSKTDAAQIVQDVADYLHETSAWPYFYPEAYINDRGILRRVIVPCPATFQYATGHTLDPEDDRMWTAEDVDLAYDHWLDQMIDQMIDQPAHALASYADDMARLDAQFQAWLDQQPEDEDTIH